MTDATYIEPADVAQREEQGATALLHVAQAYVIDCPELAEAAADDLGGIKSKLKALDEQRLALTRPLDESKRRIMELFERPRSVLIQAETVLKGAIAAWNEQERKRLEAERQAHERAMREQEDRMRAEQAALQAEAEAAKQSGDAALAEQLEEQAAVTAQTAELVSMMAPAPVADAPKLAGVSQRMDYKAEVVDLMALVKAVASGEASIELLEANTKEITKRARALKSEFKVPGVRVYAVPVISARAK